MDKATIKFLKRKDLLCDEIYHGLQLIEDLVDCKIQDKAFITDKLSELLISSGYYKRSVKYERYEH